MFQMLVLPVTLDKVECINKSYGWVEMRDPW